MDERSYWVTFLRNVPVTVPASAGVREVKAAAAEALKNIPDALLTEQHICLVDEIIQKKSATNM